MTKIIMKLLVAALVIFGITGVASVAFEAWDKTGPECEKLERLAPCSWQETKADPMGCANKALHYKELKERQAKSCAEEKKRQVMEPFQPLISFGTSATPSNVFFGRSWVGFVVILAMTAGWTLLKSRRRKPSERRKIGPLFAGYILGMVVAGLYALGMSWGETGQTLANLVLALALGFWFLGIFLNRKWFPEAAQALRVKKFWHFFLRGGLPSEFAAAGHTGAVVVLTGPTAVHGPVNAAPAAPKPAPQAAPPPAPPAVSRPSQCADCGASVPAGARCCPACGYE